MKFRVHLHRENMHNNILVFPFTKTNANAISALLASLDIHEELQHLEVALPPFNKVKPQDYQHYDRIILAVSVFSIQLQEYKKLIRKFTTALPNSKVTVIAGGPHPTGDPFSMLLNGADVVCIGEGEVVIRELLLKILNDEPYTEVQGIGYLVNGRLVRTKKQPPLNLDDFPPFSIKHSLYRPIEITRGCGWKCRFCQTRNRGTTVRHRSIPIILKYVKIVQKKFHKKRIDIRFLSPNALSYGSEDGKNLRLDRVKSLLTQVREIIGEQNNIYFGSFPSELRPETITRESVNILRNFTDSKKLVLGGQSGSDKVLMKSDRGHTKAETLRAAQQLVDAEFTVDVDIIFGLPGEEEEDVEQTIQHMLKLTEMGARIHSHTFMPLPSTPFAAAPPGIIHPRYLQIIPILQGANKLSGQHSKQETDARVIVADREESRQQKILHTN